MKTFLSIISVQTNSYSNEKLVIGLIAITQNKVFFAYEKAKLSLLKKITSQENIAQYVKNNLENVKNITDQLNVDFDNSKQVKTSSLLSKEYFSYVHNYNNGLIQYSDPVSLPIEFGNAEFESYYQKFVGTSNPTLSVKTVTSITKKLKALTHNNTELIKKADIDFVFDPQKFKGILAETKVPLITKNGDITILQSIDFTQHTATVLNNLYKTQIIYGSVHQFAIEKHSHLKKIKIAFDPPMPKSEQEKVLNLALEEYDEQFEFSEFPEAKAYIQSVEKSNNTPFSELI